MCGFLCSGPGLDRESLFGDSSGRAQQQGGLLLEEVVFSVELRKDSQVEEEKVGVVEYSFRLCEDV